MIKDEVYTVAEVAKILKVNKGFVYNLIYKKELPAIKLGTLKIRRETLERYLERLEEKHNA